MFNISYPDQFHYYETFDEQKKGDKPHYEFKKSTKKLARKEKHTLIGWEVLKKDFDHIKAHNLQPDENHEITVVRDKEKRVYGIHIKTNPQGKNRLFPKKGDRIIPMSGDQVNILFDNFKESNYGSFSNYVERSLNRNPDSLEPGKKKPDRLQVQVLQDINKAT